MNFEANNGRRWPVNVLLAVEDIELALRYHEQLEPFSCIVHLAQDASEVAEALQRFRPDAILLDEAVAATDGNAILAAVRQRSAYNAIPVIVLTGQGVPPSQAMRMGASAAIAKDSGGSAVYRTIVACLATASCAA